MSVSYRNDMICSKLHFQNTFVINFFNIALEAIGLTVSLCLSNIIHYQIFHFE